MKLLLLALLTVAASAADRLAVSLVDEKTLATRLAQGLVSYGQREATIADLFRSAGCEPELQKVERGASNVICTLPGITADAAFIIVGAHYDFVTQGTGIIDDWSGTSMLVSLYQALKPQSRAHTYQFVAFAKEEVGLNGSRKFVHNLDKAQRKQIRAFVNLECLGTSPMKVWMNRSTPELVNRLEQLAHAFQTVVAGMNVDKVGDDDTHPFLDAHVPVIALHSINQQTYAYLHKTEDRLEAIQMAEYANSYKLVAFFLAYLDTTLPL